MRGFTLIYMIFITIFITKYRFGVFGELISLLTFLLSYRDFAIYLLPKRYPFAI